MRTPVSAKVMTLNEVCTYLQISRSTLYRLLKRHDLPGFRIGSDWRFNIEALDAWICSRPLGVVDQSLAGPGRPRAASPLRENKKRNPS